MLGKAKSWLRDFYRNHRTLVKSAAIGGGLSLLGFGFLYIGVSHFHFGKIRTNLGIAPPMNALGWYLNRRFVWGERETQKEEDLSRWGVKWAATGGLSQVSFAILVGMLGLPYEGVRWGLNLTLGPLSYLINREWIFSPKGFRIAQAARRVWFPIAQAIRRVMSPIARKVRLAWLLGVVCVFAGRTRLMSTARA